MGRFKVWSIVAVVAGLAACSSNDDTILDANAASTLPGSTAAVASLTLLTSSPQIFSDGSNDATITALVRDASNNVMADVPVLFSADSGSLALSQPITTNETGTVTATLSTAGDPTNRTITVSATAGASQASVSVGVIGTTLEINGPPSLPAGDDGNFNIVLTDAGGNGIGGRQVDITSSNNNGISATPLTTDVDGQASFVVTANAGGNDTITATTLGLTATHALNVSTDTFAFTTPAADTEIPLNTNQTVTVNWQAGGAAVVGGQVSFATTRGTFNPAGGIVNTDGSGNATVTISASNAGPAVITATNSDGTTTQRRVEFVATVPATLELQANPFTVPTNDQSAITAVVRDANGNLVKGATVTFSLNDVTGGTLSVGQAITSSQGRAQTFYTASSTTSQVDGVQITATVVGFPAVTDTVAITVAQRELFIAIGTGNDIEEPNTAQYRKEWVLQVTDSNGNAVDAVDLTVSILSQRYAKGERLWNDVAGVWVTSPAAVCIDEDINNHNGILDPGEDFNGSGRIEAGNIATVVAQAGYGSGNTVTTDANGFALIDVFYAQEFALWVEVELEARTAVQGTEFAESTVFSLPIAASDVNAEDIEPPGQISPFGIDADCAVPPPGLP